MIRVTALSSSRIDPSSRFRIRQFLGPLRRHGINVRESAPILNKYRIEPMPWLAAMTRVPGLLKSRFADVTWFSRELISGRKSLEGFAGGAKVLDVDDAIWLAYHNRFSERIASMCDGVIAGNNYIADHYRDWTPRVWVVPTSVDTERWKPVPKANHSAEWVIGWSGTWSNLPYLLEIEEPLAEFLASRASAKLLVVSDRRPHFARIPADRWEFVRWSARAEVAAVQRMNVGLMPLRNDAWAKGKCAFKMLTYMSVGLPVIVSPVGVNAEILAQANVGYGPSDKSGWYKAFESLYEDRAKGTRMGVEGRRLVEEGYSVKSNSLVLAGIFKELSGK